MEIIIYLVVFLPIIFFIGFSIFGAVAVISNAWEDRKRKKNKQLEEEKIEAEKNEKRKSARSTNIKRQIEVERLVENNDAEVLEKLTGKEVTLSNDAEKQKVVYEVLKKEGITYIRSKDCQLPESYGVKKVDVGLYYYG